MQCKEWKWKTQVFSLSLSLSHFSWNEEWWSKEEGKWVKFYKREVVTVEKRRNSERGQKDVKIQKIVCLQKKEKLGSGSERETILDQFHASVTHITREIYWKTFRVSIN